MFVSNFQRAKAQADANAATFKRPYYVYVAWGNRGYEVERELRPVGSGPIYIAQPSKPAGEGE